MLTHSNFGYNRAENTHLTLRLRTFLTASYSLLHFYYGKHDSQDFPVFLLLLQLHERARSVAVCGHSLENITVTLVEYGGHSRPGVGDWPFILFFFLKSFITQTVYRMSQKECARLRENVPYVKVYRYNPKHLYPKLNGYGDNGQRSLKL